MANTKNSNVLFLYNLELDAAVQPAALLGCIVSNRHGLAMADITEPLSLDTVSNEVLHHGLCPGLGETLVVLVASNAVSMSFHCHIEVRIVNEPCGHLVKFGHNLVGKVELVKLEQGIGHLHHAPLYLNRDFLDYKFLDLHLGRLLLRLDNRLGLLRFRLRDKDWENRGRDRFLLADAESKFQDNSTAEGREMLGVM